jgi:DNA-binding MarR family transcriptional regulator
MEPHFARFGISGSQWAVLRTLHRAAEEGEPALRLTDLGDRLLIRPPSVTGVVDRLVREGFIQRSTSTTDQRAKLVRLTRSGRDLVGRVLQRHSQQITDVLAALNDHERAQLHCLLEKLGAHLESKAKGQS